MLNYFDIHFDFESGKFEAAPNRTTCFTLNIVPFLNQMTIPKNGITFDNVIINADDPDNFGIDVDFTVYHPFPGYDEYDAYDMRGVVIGDGADTLEYDSLRISRHGTDLWMKNPDGYTRWFNPTEFTSETIFGYYDGGYQNLAGNAHLNPYKYYAKHLQADGNAWYFLTGDPNFDGIFESGSSRRMELEFPMPPEGNALMFGYAVVVCWEFQGPDGPFYPVHLPEPVACSANQTPDVWYNETDGSGGDLILDVDLFAWDEQPSKLKIESSVLDNIEEFDFETYASPGGEHYSTWSVEAPAGTFTGTDGHEVWIIAECEDYDYSNGNPSLPHAEGPLAAFFRYDVYVKDDSGIPPPEVLSVTPDKGYTDSQIDDMLISGLNFQVGATVVFEEEATGITTPQLPCDFISDEILEIDLDLTGWSTGFYHVTVRNPDLQYDSLEHAFEVLEYPEGDLILEDEIHLPNEHPLKHGTYPAICVENDGDVTISYIEWWHNPEDPYDYRFWSEGYKSDDDGDTWPHQEYGMNGSYFDPIIFGFSTKIWPSTTDTAWRTFNHMHLYTDPAEWWIGYADTVFDGPYNHESACYAHDIDYANDIVQDSDGYIYLFGDRDDVISFKKSELPDRLDGGPTTNMWELHPKYEMVPYGRLSRVRSSALYNDTSYIIYYEPDNDLIRLAKMVLPDWETWDTSAVVWDADGSGAHRPRDPGLFVDDSGFYVTFVRTDFLTGFNEVCYTWSADGIDWSEPVVVRSNVFTILETPIFRYTVDDVPVIGTMWWEDTRIYASWSTNEGISWANPVLLSTMYDDNGYPDFWIADTGNWHFTFASYNPTSELWELHYRRGHIELY